MTKCNCYCVGIRPEPRYNQYTRDYVGSVDVKYEYCAGTKQQDECSCGGDRTKCDFYPEIREKAVKEEKFIDNSVGVYNSVKVYIDDDGATIFKYVDGTGIKMTNNGLYAIDKYGNELLTNEIGVNYKSNTPSYEELYNYWLNTKQND